MKESGIGGFSRITRVWFVSTLVARLPTAHGSCCPAASRWAGAGWGLLQVGAGAVRAGGRAGLGLGAARKLAHLLELLAGGELLGHQRRLDAVEQTLEPPYELGLDDAELGLGGLFLVQRLEDRLEFVPEVVAERLSQLVQRVGVDLSEASLPQLVQRSGSNFVEHRPSH